MTSITRARVWASRVSWRPVLVMLASLSVTPAFGQGPQVDVLNPPGSRGGGTSLGPAIGAVGAPGLSPSPANQDAPISGRLGPGVSRAPRGGFNPQGHAVPGAGERPKAVESMTPAALPITGDLEQPTAEDAGPPDGLTLDQAIDLLVRNDLTLLAQRFEIPQAQADILTASLRANPIFYADAQLIPYQSYSRARPGGPTQYDVNLTIPLDVSHKRQARTEVACRAKRVVEAQYLDAVRLRIDNLYTVYVDVVSAGETLRYSQAYKQGIERLLSINRELLKGGQIVQANVDALTAQLEQSELQVRESIEAVGQSTRNLVLMLNLPRDVVPTLRVRSSLRDVGELPSPSEALVQTALANRPDLQAYELGLARARAEVGLANAEKYSDVYLLAQPYTFQDNSPFGDKSATSFALGLTVNLPVFNRNQGNIARAHLNVNQTQVELARQQNQVVKDVDDAVREFELSRSIVLELEREILPASRRVRDSAFRRFQGGETSAIEFLAAQKDYNDAVRQYRDALVRHRRSMLDLNTAVGLRVLP